MLTTREVKQELTHRAARVTEPGFLREYIAPYAGYPVPDSAVPQSRVIQLDGTGACTVEVDWGAGPAVFAKLYPGDDGLVIYNKLQLLRREGFGEGDRYQVVEPLAWIPELGMMLARQAPGVAVSAHVGTDPVALDEGVRESARWLASLHTTPLRIGKPISLLISGEVMSLNKRLAKVVAKRPDHLDVALSMNATLERLAEDTQDGISAQSHGQFRPIHVFTTPDAVTVIDLDRSRPCDPARDVAEFIHRLRMTTFWHGEPGAAEAPTRAFLESYTEIAPESHLTNLRFHWARYIFHSLNRKMKDDGADRDRDATVAFYASEFEAVASGAFGL
jgi:hypothetical protein